MDNYRKLEFNIFSGIFLLLMFGLLYPSIVYNVFELQRIYGWKFEEYHQVFDYYLNYLLPSMAVIIMGYVTFLFVNFVIVPKFLEERRWLPGILLLIPTAVLLFLTLMVAGSYYKGYLLGVYSTVKGAHMFFAKAAFITTIFLGILYVAYYILRTLYLKHLHKILAANVHSGMGKEILYASAAFVALMCLTFSDSRDLFLIIFFFAPQVLAVFFISQYRIFPEFFQHQVKTRMFRDLFFLVILAAAMMGLITRAMTHHGGDELVKLMFAGSFVSVVFVLPLSYWLARSRSSQARTVVTLKKALGHSAANLDFLRAQINPHFLFNALNTLYGTALQEDAARTSEGIQKLGDMMRFMLHDNHLEKIPLDKEVAYLQNYIALQRLRVMSSPDILIEVNIDEGQCQHEIAPMLLIPFVENAFKHGISLRSRSRIVISLSCTPDKIFFDVYNSVHARPENDPEKDSMGIGLNNVKERLALLYPNKHELSIRQTTTEFFVHLTIDVNN
ncbi:sensor histidine kinase [Chitinophaga vietnamensis]|uniref:sensor histidine kinase n=1 Tax=Chitinophaga vietnamensis TaxID=2593957 RepID=UPI00191BDE0C|nr:histidine kinase [Chitinophaga vietnamensis]